MVGLALVFVCVTCFPLSPVHTIDWTVELGFNNNNSYNNNSPS